VFLELEIDFEFWAIGTRQKKPVTKNAGKASGFQELGLDLGFFSAAK
jgi:hypothetical protein